MIFTNDYNRQSAVSYAHKWAYGRNPSFYNYDEIGGDCTNFVSQCLLAGNCPMNYTETYGWYYKNANNKAPAWTGVPYLFNFLTRSGQSIGPVARECTLNELIPGDIVQLSFNGEDFRHTPIVVAVTQPFRPNDILVAAHTNDTDYRRVSTYPYKKIRCLHIEGIYRP